MYFTFRLFFNVTALIFIFSTTLFAQENCNCPTQNKTGRGSIYVTWGYHRDWYTNSTIHFTNHENANYDFEIQNAKAIDSPDYDDLFNRPISVPQYIFNLGYMFNKKGDWGIEFSWDHIKYILPDYQTLHVKGTIDNVRYDLDTVIGIDFVRFEHTNGGNYCMINGVKRWNLLHSKNGMHWLSVFAKAGAGVPIPKTDSRMFGRENDGPFHISGYVVGASAALRYNFFKYLFLEGSLKGAFANYNNTYIDLDHKGRAKHHFFSAQLIWSGGFNVPF